MNKSLMFLFAFTFLFKGGFSQLDVFSEIRPRTEYRNGYKILPDSLNPAIFTSQRTRISFDYLKDELRLYVTFQDVRLWGQQELKTHNPSVGLSETWAELSLKHYWKIKVGRQALNYDNGRLFSNNNWIQQGQFHDALKICFSSSGYSFDLISAFNQKNELLFGTDYSGFNNYKTLNLFRVEKKFNKIHSSLMAVADGHQKENTTNTLYVRATYGGFLTYKFSEKLKIRGSAYYQSGKHKSGNNIDAYYHMAEASKRFSKTTFTLGYEYFSGKSSADTLNKTVASFDALYGIGHGFNGYMDYFTNMPLHTNNAGLINPYFFVNYDFTNNFSGNIKYHFFKLAHDVADLNTIYDRNLGNEIDFSFKYKINTDVFLDFGYFRMFPTKTMAFIKGGNKDKRAEFAFIMLTIKPTLFSEKKE